MKWILRNPKRSVPIVGLLLIGAAWLVFGFFGVHLLFVDDEVAEAPPVFAAAESRPDAATAETPRPNPPTTAAEATPTIPPSTAGATTTITTTTLPGQPVATQPQIVTEYVGTFRGLDHPTSGIASVLGDGTGQRFVRFEMFETDNGPDLNVYLVNSSAGGTDDFVDLGNLKGNIGDQNYEIPPGVDLRTYDTVVIWCVRFSSPFGEAKLQ